MRQIDGTKNFTALKGETWREWANRNIQNGEFDEDMECWLGEFLNYANGVDAHFNYGSGNFGMTLSEIGGNIQEWDESISANGTYQWEGYN